MFSVPFELEQVEFRILILGIPLSEKAQKESWPQLQCLLSSKMKFADSSDLLVFFGTPVDSRGMTKYVKDNTE